MKQQKPAQVLQGMHVVDRRYVLEMSPALPVSVPLCLTRFF